jgi:hypothetical protein
VNRRFRGGTRRARVASSDLNDFACLRDGTAPALSHGEHSMVEPEKEGSRMTQVRSMGYALVVFSLVMVAAVAVSHAAPPDEVQAPRTQEVNAP